MVVFSCGQCGEALKKAQVEKHYQTKCRQNNVFSCIDCGKDFWGNNYEQHTKCISEEEKYSGKNFVPKPSANKGEVKQQQWLQQVQAAIDKVKANPQLKDLLERLKDYPNIPRKKAKFENFLKNSLRVRNPRLMAQVWDLIMAHTEKASQASTETADKKTENQSTIQESSETSRISETVVDNQSNDSQDVKKLNKRERKEERRKQRDKVEKKHKHTNGVENDCDNDNDSQSDRKSKKKKKKKRKHQEEEEEEEAESPKKRKRSEEEGKENGVSDAELEEITNGNGVSELEETVNDEEEDSEPPLKKYKTKFDWAGVIQQVLKKKGELSVKKLRKKVLSEYLSQGCTEKSEEKLWARFDKKLKKNPTFKVLKDRVKLMT